MLKLKNVSLSYGENEPNALTNINIDIKPGNFYGLLGESGSGKSSICKIVLGLTTNFTGQLDKIPENLKIAYIAQDKGVLPTLSIIDNIVLGKKKKTDAVISECKEILKNLKINKDLNEKVSDLSGGQIQRVALARAFFWGFDLLIADEPLTGLDSIIKTEVITLLEDIIKKDKNKSILYITHDSNELRDNQEAFIIKDGFIVANDKINNLKNSSDKYISKLAMGFS